MSESEPPVLIDPHDEEQVTVFELCYEMQNGGLEAYQAAGGLTGYNKARNAYLQRQIKLARQVGALLHPDTLQLVDRPKEQ